LAGLVKGGPVENCAVCRRLGHYNAAIVQWREAFGWEAGGLPSIRSIAAVAALLWAGTLSPAHSMPRLMFRTVPTPQRLRSMLRARSLALRLAVLIFGCCFVHEAVADGEVRNVRRPHPAPQVGWGWDSRSGWYAGPIFGRSGHGYFRCYDPGFGWHPCPHYLPANAAPKPPKGWWRYHFILPD
jgi:hypothetical protein